MVPKFHELLIQREFAQGNCNLHALFVAHWLSRGSRVAVLSSSKGTQIKSISAFIEKHSMVPYTTWHAFGVFDEANSPRLLLSTNSNEFTFAFVNTPEVRAVVEQMKAEYDCLVR